MGAVSGTTSTVKWQAEYKSYDGAATWPSYTSEEYAKWMANEGAGFTGKVRKVTKTVSVVVEEV